MRELARGLTALEVATFVVAGLFALYIATVELFGLNRADPPATVQACNACPSWDPYYNPAQGHDGTVCVTEEMILDGDYMCGYAGDPVNVFHWHEGSQ